MAFAGTARARRHRRRWSIRSSRSARSRPACSQPVQMEFIGDNDFFVLEKATGLVKRIRNGGTPEVVLDLTVNSASERGLLGIALDKYFRHNGFVYLYWSERTPAPTTAGADGADARQPARSLQVGRPTLTFDKTLHCSRAFQKDGSRTNGVPLARQSQRRRRARRARRQDLPDRRRHRPPRPDAEPDRRPVRLPVPRPRTTDHRRRPVRRPGHRPRAPHGRDPAAQPDGSAPKDNPFYKVGAERGGQVGASLKKVFAYGIRNGFGMAFDPFSGDLWEQENGDDSFSEINRVEGASTRAGCRSWARSSVSRSSGDREQSRPDGRSGRRQLLRPAAGPVGAGEHRDHAARGVRASVQAPRFALQRPRDVVEVRVRPRRDRLRRRARAGQALPRRHVRRLRAASAAATSSGCRSTTTASRSIRTTGA